MRTKTRGCRTAFGVSGPQNKIWRQCWGDRQESHAAGILCVRVDMDFSVLEMGAYRRVIV